LLPVQLENRKAQRPVEILVTIQPIEIALFRRFAPGVGLRRHCLWWCSKAGAID